MRGKILSIIISICLILTSFVFIDVDKHVSADITPPECILDLNYINIIASHLSNIIDNEIIYPPQDDYNNVEKGRFFNSKGEREAARYLDEKMNELDNLVPEGDGSYEGYPYLEKITDHEKDDSLDIISEGLYINGDRIEEFYIAPRWNLTAWWPFPNIPLVERNKTRLSTNFSYEDPLEIRLLPRFDQARDVFDIECMLELNEKMDDGIIHNESTFYEFAMNKFAEKYDFTWGGFR
jgi:hypothetical protein